MQTQEFKSFHVSSLHYWKPWKAPAFRGNHGWFNRNKTH